jgi:uncharacterized protein with GYD domain
MLFLQISRHSIESCPMNNEKVKKVYVDSFAKMGQLMKKYGIKMIGGWAAMTEHLNVAVCETPSMDALMKFSMEPEMMSWLAYNSTEIIPVMSLFFCERIRLPRFLIRSIDADESSREILFQSVLCVNAFQSLRKHVSQRGQRSHFSYVCVFFGLG